MLSAVVFGSALFHTAVYRLSAVFRPSRATSTDSQLWCQYCTTLAHALIQTTAATYVLAAHPELQKDLYGYTDVSACTLAFSCGFFAWDTFHHVLVAEKFELPFVIHGGVCMCIYFLGNWPRPYLQWMGSLVLLYEVSSIFLNIRYLMLIAGRAQTLIFAVVEAAFCLLFLTIRLGLGLPISWFWLRQEYESYYAGHTRSVPITLLFVGANVITNSLNVFWAAGIVKKAASKLSGKKTIAQI
jgi:hypothetical protein